MIVIAVVVSYIIGAISFSYLAGKLLRGIDIRKHGSGNAGATNTMRVLGVGPGIAVLLLDTAKGVAAVWLGIATGAGEWAEIFCGLAVIVGHNWPVFFGFRGGKGIATTIGVMATLAFVPALIAGFVAIALIAVTRYVSVGSLVFAGLLPIFIAAFERIGPVFWGGLVLALFAYIRHRSNIVKLVKGQENKLGSRKQSANHG